MKNKFSMDMVRSMGYSAECICVCCKSEKEYNVFRKYLDSVGETWINGSSYLEYEPMGFNWNGMKYGEEPCFYVLEKTIGTLDSAIFNDNIVLNFNDYDWISYFNCEFMERCHED